MKKMTYLKKDSLLRLYYRRTSHSSRCSKLLLQNHTKSRFGFQIDLNWQENTCRGFLQRFEGEAVFLERLELILHSGFYSTFGLHKSLPTSGAFRVLHNNPYFLYLEQQIRHDPGSTQFLLLPAGTGNQWLHFELRQGRWSGRIKSLKIIWNFDGQRFEPHGREALVPVKIAVNANKERQNIRSITAPVVFWDRVMSRIAGEATLKRKSEPVHRGLELRPAPLFSSPYRQTAHAHFRLTELSIRQIRLLLHKVQVQRDTFDFFLIRPEFPEGLGDWLEWERHFGLAKLSKEIRAHKLKAGLYFFPFLASPQSQIVRSQPQIFLKKDGQMVSTHIASLKEERSYIFDITHPGYIKWLTWIVYTIIRKWKFSYLKLDGLDAAYLSGDNYDPGKSGALGLRESLSWLRRAAGSKAIISRTGSLRWPIVGLADTIDTVDIDDIAPAFYAQPKRSGSWQSSASSRHAHSQSKPQLEFILKKILLQGCLQHRFASFSIKLSSLDTFQEKRFSQRQVQLLFSILALSGAEFCISQYTEDFAFWSDPKSVKMFDLHRKCSSHRPLPLGDAFGKFALGIYQPAGFLGVWNPSPQPKRVEFLPPPVQQTESAAFLQVRDYWTGQSIPWHWQGDRVQIGLGPFESFVADLRKPFLRTAVNILQKPVLRKILTLFPLQ